MRVYLPHEVPRIGELLRESGLLTYAEVSHVVEVQRATGERFGEAAVRLGLVSEADLRHALHNQWRLRAIAVVAAAGIAIASPTAGVAGTSATLNLMGYVRPVAAMQVERGHVLIPIDRGEATEIELIEKAGGNYEVEIHSQSAQERGGQPTLVDASGTSGIPYEIHYGGKNISLGQTGRAVLVKHLSNTSQTGRSSQLSIHPRPISSPTSLQTGSPLSDNLTLTIRVQ